MLLCRGRRWSLPCVWALISATRPLQPPGGIAFVCRRKLPDSYLAVIFPPSSPGKTPRVCVLTEEKLRVCGTAYRIHLHLRPCVSVCVGGRSGCSEMEAGSSRGTSTAVLEHISSLIHMQMYAGTSSCRLTSCVDDEDARSPSLATLLGIQVFPFTFSSI